MIQVFVSGARSVWSALKSCYKYCIGVLRVNGLAATELREFVYLDEVSVFSLLASRVEHVETQRTKKDAASLKLGFSSGGSVGIESDTQVVLKSFIQSHFKKLYDRESHQFLLHKMSEMVDTSPLFTGSTASECKKFLDSSPSVVNMNQLVRGGMLEISVQLRADDLFVARTLLSSAIDLVDGNQELLGLSSLSGMEDARSATQIIDKLLVGLVPLSGEILGYRRVLISDDVWIVPASIAESLPSDLEIVSDKIELVGVTEESLYWKDVRRLLFTNSVFTVLCRVKVEGLSSEWNSVKLLDALSRVLPDSAKEIRGLGRKILSLMSSDSSHLENGSVEMRRFSMALLYYGNAMVMECSLDRDVIQEEIMTIAHKASQGYATAAARYQSFEEISAFVKARCPEATFDSHDLADMRSNALRRAGFDEFGDALPTRKQHASLGEDISEERTDRPLAYLECEIVAIYW